MNKKQAVFTLAKITIAALLLSWLFHKVDIKSEWSMMLDAKRLPILAGIFFCWTGVLIAGLRWYWLLKAFKVGTSIRAAMCIAQIGQFFLVFLPGPAGDDLTRMLYISRLSKGHLGEAYATVLLDRCIGLASILLLAVICIPWQWHLLAASPQTYWMAVGISAAGGGVFVAGLLFFLIDGHFMQRVAENILQRFPASGITGQLSRISGHVFSNKPVIAKVAGVALATQILLCAVYCLAGQSVGIHIPVTVWLGFVPIVLAANALPITVAGMGIRELLLITFLGVLAHVEAEQAVAASLIAFFMMLVICMLGGVVYIFYRPVKKSPEAP